MSVTVQYVDYPPAGSHRGWYVTDPDYDEIIAGPFLTMQEAEGELHKITEDEPNVPWDVNPFGRSRTV